MERQPVADADLAEFCDRFSRQYEGWLATMISREHGRAAEILVQDLPLEGVAVDSDTNGDRTFLMIVGVNPTKHLTQVVLGVQRVEKEIAAAGLPDGLHIVTVRGTTDIRFRILAISEEEGKLRE